MKRSLLEVVTKPTATRWAEVAGRIQSGLWPTADFNSLTNPEIRSGPLTDSSTAANIKSPARRGGIHCSLWT
jgi:hypothetical protein